MSKLVRYLSRRRTGKGIKRGVQEDKKGNKHVIVCRVVLLDGTDVTIELPKGSLGDILYQRVFYHLDLLETSYFGLQYTDSANINHWLDKTKKIKKQVTIGPPYTLRLRVKFFPKEPSALKEELTRYQFFQHCKSDILNGVLLCPDESMAVELAAYALQSELGDYDEEEHTPAFISEFRFMPDQTEEMEVEIFNKYKSLRGQGMTPDKAELQYLHKAKWLDLYGVDMHYVLGRDGLDYKLGLTPTGVLVFEGAEKIGLFYWPKIIKFNFKRKRLILVVVEDNEGDDQSTEVKQEHTFVFRTQNPKACKHLWKCAIEHHTFFRVVVQPTNERSSQGFIRLGSRFRYSGRTQFEQLNRSHARRSVRFERQPSRRFSRRASLEARERIRKRNAPSSLPQQIGNSPAVNADAASAGSNTPSVSPTGANPVLNGTTDLSSPMDRLDNLISSNSGGRARTPSSRDRSSTDLASPTLLEHSEAAQAKIKGLSDPPEPMPRPNKDINLYQNNQVKVIGTKEKVPIEIKSNILKARADEERHNGNSVMQEDDNVSTESEDESPMSPMSPHTMELAVNGSKLPRNASTSSSRSMPSPVNNAGYINISRDGHSQSVGSPLSPGALSLSDEGAASSTGSPQSTRSVTSRPSVAPTFCCLDDDSNGNMLLSDPVIRAFLNNSENSLLGSLGKVKQPLGAASISSEESKELVETAIDSSPTPTPCPSAEESSPFESPADGTRSSKRSIAGTNRPDSKTNGDTNSLNRPLPKPAPRKYEKRVCVTTVL
ncbi:band 4.1-like protein 5 isoform X2 [Watersipora subatra]|uniref:band 4.1-like protein 5 isoform X2 n=1 Tax=Watersipora subatra TaxID=2589382 RepID=UPI00355C8D22